MKFIYVLVIIFQISSGFLDVNHFDIPSAYLDASVDNLKSVLDETTNSSYNQFDNLKCYNQIKFFKNHVKNASIWAMKVVDSWSKLPSGLASGNIRDIGNFEQCLGVEENSFDPEIGIFRGQMCVTPISPILHRDNVIVKNLMNRTSLTEETISSLSGFPSAYFAVCIPDMCSPEMWGLIVNSFINRHHFKIGNNMDRLCQTSRPKSWSTLDKIAIRIFLLILILMTISTGYEIYLKDLNRSSNHLGTIFSVYSNSKSLFSLSKSSDQIECLNGIRALTIMWIVLGHTYIISLQQPMVNPIAITKWYKTPIANFMFHTPFACDTFLMMGGFLLCWIHLKNLDKSNGKCSHMMMILGRYVRLALPLMSVILFLVTMFKFIGSGPLWQDIVEVRSGPCLTNWWKTLTFFQNFMGMNICVGESWYLAVDFQLFCLSIFLITGIWKKPNQFIPIVWSIIGFSCGYTIWVIYNNNYTPSALNGNNVWTFMHDIYYVTQTRMGPYFIGILLAYYMYKLRNKKIKLPKSITTLGWISSIVFFCLVYYAIYDVTHYPENEHIIKSAIYQTFLRIIWTINIGWIIVYCQYSRRGFLKTFLCYPLWRPLSRLSFSIYITHMHVQTFFIAKSQTQFYFNDFVLWHRFIGDFGVTVFVATIWALAFEFPVVRLLAILFKSKRDENNSRPSELMTDATIVSTTKITTFVDRFTYNQPIIA